MRQLKLLCLGFEVGEAISLVIAADCHAGEFHFLMMDPVEIVQPDQAEIEAVEVLVFSCCGNAFIDGKECIGEVAKICLQGRHVEECMRKDGLVVSLNKLVFHSVVEVSVEGLKGCGVISRPPCIDETTTLLVVRLVK
jgi:hypothetical protein